MLHEPDYWYHWQLCRHFYQSPPKHRVAWQGLSHKLRLLRSWCCYRIVDLEETV